MLHDFLYHDPGSMADALSFLREHGEESTVFSGGTDLFVAIRAGLTMPQHVVDLKGIDELHSLSWSDAEGLSIGACVTVNDLVESAIVREKFPVLYAAGSELATFQLRNRATVIGNIVTASPCGDMSSPLLVHGGQVVLSSAAGERKMPLGEFITGVKRTLIRSDEIVSRIVVPADWAGAAGGYEKLKRIKGHDLGVVAVAMIKSSAGFRVAISSAAPTPLLLPDFSPTATEEEIRKTAQEMITPIDDVRATAEYRAYMVDVYIRRLMKSLEGNT
ncbi:MAG TPA: FAD binding domain-containing protein [Alkalispirochaeta sp.]|nr:FAD binding domain-containing protein [Alkalispirochaeta sp.]